MPSTSVICALGQRSRTDVVETLRGMAPFVRVIGDASRVSAITNAVYWGYHAALDIESKKEEIKHIACIKAEKI